MSFKLLFLSSYNTTSSPSAVVFGRLVSVAVVVVEIFVFVVVVAADFIFGCLRRHDGKLFLFIHEILFKLHPLAPREAPLATAHFIHSR